MAEEGPLGGAEKGVGFYVRSAGARADTALFVFDEEFADERFAEAVEGRWSVSRVLREAHRS